MVSFSASAVFVQTIHFTNDNLKVIFRPGCFAGTIYSHFCYFLSKRTEADRCRGIEFIFRTAIIVSGRILFFFYLTFHNSNISIFQLRCDPFILCNGIGRLGFLSPVVEIMFNFFLFFFLFDFSSIIKLFCFVPKMASDVV